VLQLLRDSMLSLSLLHALTPSLLTVMTACATVISRSAEEGQEGRVCWGKEEGETLMCKSNLVPGPSPDLQSQHMQR
jgi:hypothetical protein